LKWALGDGKINSFNFGMNGFMPAAFEHQEVLSFGNGDIFVTGLVIRSGIRNDSVLLKRSAISIG